MSSSTARVNRGLLDPARRPVIVAVTVVAAVVINLVVYALGVALGGDFDFTNKGKTIHVSPASIILMTTVPLLVGMTLTALLSLKWSAIIKAALVIGPVLALVTIGIMTIPADLDTTSTITLAVTHVALVPVMIAGLLALARRAG